MGVFIFSSGMTSSKASRDPRFNWNTYPFAKETFQPVLILIRDIFLQTNIRRIEPRPATALDK